MLASKYKTYVEIVSTLQKMYEAPDTEDFVAYVVEVPKYDPGPVVLFLSRAPGGQFIYYDVRQNAAVPPWPPPALRRLFLFSHIHPKFLGPLCHLTTQEFWSLLSH